MFYVEPVKLIVTVWLYPGNSEADHTEALTGVARGFLSAEDRGIRLTAGVADALNRNDVDVVFRREVIPAGAGAWRGASDPGIASEIQLNGLLRLVGCQAVDDH